jgi:hypothetical protein
MLYGYARVSSADQGLSVQRDAPAAAGCTVIPSQKVSGTNTDGREELATLLQFLRDGGLIRAAVAGWQWPSGALAVDVSPKALQFWSYVIVAPHHDTDSRKANRAEIDEAPRYDCVEYLGMHHWRARR